MAASYLFDDSVLLRIWTQFRAWLELEDPWTLHLVDADHTWVDGEDQTDVSEATFDGYAPIELDMANWQAPSVTAHIGSLPYDPPPQFDYASSGVSPVTIYAFFLLNADGDFQYGERVATPKIINPGDGLKVSPIIRDKTCRE